jgi:hypothetical protein
MNVYQYKLEPYKRNNTRYRCPNCQQSDKTFSLYIDKETGEYIHPTVGRCNREIKCGYHYTPKQYFRDNNISFDRTDSNVCRPGYIRPQPKPISFIPVKVFKASLDPSAFEENHFVQFLIRLFGVEVASQLVGRYFIATSRHWNGATVFWQIDINSKIRTGKIMLYSPDNGKRVKEPFNHVTWAHKALNDPEFEMKQCLFGEHLLSDRTKHVAIVESEKTAIIASAYLPQFIWLATGGLVFNVDKCSVLKGRNVVLFPDVKAFDKWTKKANELSSIARIEVSDLLEGKATEADRDEGLDLADFLLRLNYEDFVKPEVVVTEILSPIVSLPSGDSIMPPETVNYHLHTEKVRSVSWSQEIFELENYFSSAVLPSYSLRLNSFSTITDCSLFVESHLSTLHQYNGKRTFMPYLSRLNDLRSILAADSNTNQSF